MPCVRPPLIAALLCALTSPLPARAAAPGGPLDRESAWRLPGSTAHVRPMPGRRFRSPPGQNLTPNLKYYGGKVLSNLRLVSVYWENAGYFASAEGADFISRTDAFYQAFVVSSQFDWLSEYDTTIPAVGGSPGTNQSIGHGTYAGGFVMTPLTVTTTQFDEPSIQRELNAQIAAGKLPAPDANTLYMMHFARGIILADGSSQSCNAYCAYHDSYSRNGKSIYFAAIPDHSPPSPCQICGEARGSDGWYKNLTSSASHEAVEATTDAEVGAVGVAGTCGPAWCDPSPSDYGSEHAEIGDVCEDDWGPGTEGTFAAGDNTVWTVQREWSNKYNACIVNAPEAFRIASVTPASIAVHGAGTYDFTVTTSAAQAPGLTAQLGTFQLPSLVSVSFTPQLIVPGATATMHVTISSGGATQPFNVGFFANSGNTLAYGLAGLTFDDFTATTTSSSLALKAGQSATLQVQTQATPGSQSQEVSFQLTGKPPGVSMTASPVTVTTGGSTSLVISAIAGAPSATNTQLTITMTNGLGVRTLTVPLVLDGDDFTATSDAATPLPVQLGSTTRFHIATTTAHGNPQTLTPSAKGVPPGVTMVFDRPTVQSGQTITATVQTQGGAAPGPGQLVVTVAGAAVSTDVAISTLLTAGGCATGGSGLTTLLGLAALALWQRRRRV